MDLKQLYRSKNPVLRTCSLAVQAMFISVLAIAYSGSALAEHVIADDGNCFNDINIPVTGPPDDCGSFDREAQLQTSGDSTTWEINTLQATLGTPDYEWTHYEKQDINDNGSLGTNTATVDVISSFSLDTGTIQLTNANLPDGWEDAAVLFVFKDGAKTDQAWYLYESLNDAIGAGGLFYITDILNGHDLSNVTVYLAQTTPELPGVPLPAAVWLFGGAMTLLGGVARKRRTV